jgi:hypothetical protein
MHRAGGRDIWKVARRRDFFNKSRDYLTY